jgi:hypothetical protein
MFHAIFPRDVKGRVHDHDHSGKTIKPHHKNHKVDFPGADLLVGENAVMVGAVYQSVFIPDKITTQCLWCIIIKHVSGERTFQRGDDVNKEVINGRISPPV